MHPKFLDRLSVSHSPTDERIPPCWTFFLPSSEEGSHCTAILEGIKGLCINIR